MKIFARKSIGFAGFACIAAMFLVSAPVVAFDQVRVFAQVDSEETIYAGEQFAYRIIIDGRNEPGKVDLSSLAEYNPKLVSARDASQYSINIVNGRKTESAIKRYVMTYQLLAAEPGDIYIPGLQVVVDGKDYLTNSVEVQITEPGRTEKMDLEMSLSKQSCYVGEPVVMTVQWYILRDVVDAAGEYAFNVPVLNSGEFYVEDIDTQTGSGRYNLSINGVGVRLGRRQAMHKGKEYAVIGFSKVLIPKAPGDVELKEAMVSVDFAIGRGRRSGFFNFQREYKRFMAKSAALSLEVLPLPSKNKPTDFYGLIGKYTISADAAPNKVYVGDPITLTIKIGGGKYLKPVRWPELKQIKELEKNFKIPSQRSAPVIENGFKVFTQTIRANNDSITEIPPIGLSYFDAEKGKFVTAKSESVKLDVAPTRIATAADIEGREFVKVSREVEAIQKGISANYEALDALEDQQFTVSGTLLRPGYILSWGFGLGLLLVTSIVKAAVHTSPERIAAKRRANARTHAVSILSRVSGSEPAEAIELFLSAMRGYVGRRFDRQSRSLTGADCERIILAGTGDAEIAGQFRQLIESAAAAQYSGGQGRLDRGLADRAIDLIAIIDKKVKR